MVSAMLQILTKQNIKTMSHLLEIKNLDVKFDTDEGRITAIDNVSLKLDQGKVLGIVGESGSGKSVTAKSIMQLNPGNTIYNDDAEIIIDNENVLKFTSKNDLKKIPNIDVLIIGINAPWPRGCINNDFHNSYYNYPYCDLLYKFCHWFLGDPRIHFLTRNHHS